MITDGELVVIASSLQLVKTLLLSSLSQLFHLLTACHMFFYLFIFLKSNPASSRCYHQNNRLFAAASQKAVRAENKILMI